eukprot:1667193-Pyramimonas_sp.AAC.1
MSWKRAVRELALPALLAWLLRILVCLGVVRARVASSRARCRQASLSGAGEFGWSEARRRRSV